MAHFVSVRFPDDRQLKAGIKDGHGQIFIGHYGHTFEALTVPYVHKVHGKDVTVSFEQHGVTVVTCEIEGGTERFTMTKRGVCRHDMRADGNGNFSSRGIKGVEIRHYEGDPAKFPGTKAM